MRAAIVTLIALALVSPAAALAADTAPAPAPTVTKMTERIAFPRRQPRVKVRHQTKRKTAKSVAASKRPTTARPAPAIESPPAVRQAGAPACLSNPNLDNGRRCLRLADPGPAPTPTLVSPSITTYVPDAPFATPSRSWLGAFSKRFITQIVEIAEVVLVDRADWRAAMADEIQWQLEQARSKEQQARLKQQEKPKQHIGQASPKDAPANSRPRRVNGAQT